MVMRKQTLCLLMAFLLVASFAVTGEPVQASPDPEWEDWPYYKEIEIDCAKVEGENLENFPVLISWNSDSDLAAHVGVDNGDDILFTDNAGVKLDHEIENFVKDNGQLVAWVRVPTLYDNENVKITIRYGNASATNQENPTGVWDDNFKLVTHMKDDPDASHIKDSTINANHGTKKAINEPIEADGKIGKTQDFDGSDDYIGVADADSLDVTTGATIEAWIKVEALTTWHKIISKLEDWVSAGEVSYDFQVTDTTKKLQFSVSPDGNVLPGETIVIGDTVLGTATDYYIVARYDGSYITVFLQGVIDCTPIAYSSDIYAGTGRLTIGARWDSSQSVYKIFFNGIIDEARISDTARSAGWILTTFNNQSDPASFYSVGSEEEVEVNIAPNKPTNLQPTGVQTTTSITISCVATDNDGDDMNVHFYDNSDNSLIDNIWIENGQTAQVTWDGLAHGQMYVFFAGVQDNNGAWGENSDTQYFWVILHGPELDKPIENRPYFEWSDLHADNYRLLVDNDQYFSPPIENRVLTENHYQIPPENALDNGVWYWKVIAYFDGEAVESDVWSFVVGNPGIQISLSCYSEVQGGENQEFKVYVRDLEGNLVDADSAQLSLYDPNSNLILDNVSMEREEEGIYVLVFNTGGYPTGEWLVVAWVQKGPLAAEDRVYWRLVQAGPFGISIVGYPDLTAPTITFELEIHNEGDIKADATVEWWIDDAGSNRVDEGVLTKAVDPGGKWYPKIDADVGSEGDYTLYSRVWWEETEHAEAKGLFTATRVVVVPPIFFITVKPLPPKPTYDVTIQVLTVERLPLENSTVYVDGRVVATGADGMAKLELERGTYTVRIVKLGYETKVATIVVEKDTVFQFFLYQLFKPCAETKRFLDDNWMWIVAGIVAVAVVGVSGRR